MNGPTQPDKPVDPVTILSAVMSIQGETDVMEKKFSYWDWLGVVVLAVAVVTVCGAVFAAALGAGPLSGGASIAGAIVACIVALWWFIDHCLDLTDRTVEMVEEQIAIKEKIRRIEERLGIHH